MGKAKKTLGINKRKECVRLIWRKEKTYYPFLFKLLSLLEIRKPDFQDEKGNNPDIMEKYDKSYFYTGESDTVYEVVRYEKIFLFIHTDLRDELGEFVLENCEFVKKKDY